MKNFLPGILLFICTPASIVWGQGPSFNSFINRVTTQYNVDVALAPELVTTLDSIRDKGQYETIESLLEELLRTTNISYRIIDGNKILLRREDNLKTGNDYVLTGNITDEEGVPLSFAAVSISDTEQGTFSDEFGDFILHTRDTTGEVIIHFLGYDALHIPVSAVLNGVHTYRMKTNPLPLEQVIIVVPFDQVHSDEQTQDINLRGYQLLSSDEFISGNLDRLINHLTGYTHYSSEQGIRIRSSDAENALFMMDEIPVFDPYHFYNIFTPFNGHYFNSVDLYKNNIPVEYGGRIDGMIRVDSEPNRINTSHLILDSDLLLSSIAANLKVSDKLSLQAGGRISHTGILNEALADTNTMNFSKGGFRENDEWTTVQRPEFNFYDINLGLHAQIGQHHQLYLSGYKSSDYLENTFSTAFRFDDNFHHPIDVSQTINSRDDWDNEGLAVVMNSYISKKAQLDVSGYYSFYKKDISYVSMLEEDRQGMVRTLSNEGLQSSLLRSGGAKTKLRYELNANTGLQAGIDIQHHEIELVAKENNSPYLLEVQTEDEQSFFGEYNWKLTNGFGGTAGARVTRLESTGQLYVQPNLRLFYHITDDLSLKASYSNNIQAVRELTLENRFGREVDFLALSSDQNGYPVLKSDKFMIGAQFGKKYFSFDAELYYKKTNGLISVRAARPDPGFDNNDPPKDFYGVFMGEGWTAGLDVLGTYTGKRMEISLAYTLSKISERYDMLFRGASFSPKEDRRHQLKFSTQYRIGHITLSGLVNYKSKAPYISFIRVNDHGPGDIGEAEQESVVQYLPPYLSVDLAVDYGFKINRTQGQVGISLLNATNHVNINDLQHIGRVSRGGPGGNDGVYHTQQTELLGRTMNAHITLRF